MTRRHLVPVPKIPPTGTHDAAEGVAMFTPADLAELLLDAHTLDLDDPIPAYVARAWIWLDSRHPDLAAWAADRIDDADYLARLNLAKLAAVTFALAGSPTKARR